MSPQRRWRVRLARRADEDFRHAVAWSAARFGLAQAQTYAAVLRDALEELEAGPNVPLARPRSELRADVFSLHVQRRGRSGRHVVYFRVSPLEEPPTIEVLRILHDAMDPSRHF
jgi:plasmid stabilization system protein ParE